MRKMFVEQPLASLGSAKYCTLNTKNCTLHTVHYTLHTVQCTLHTAHCTLNTAHLTLHTAHCIQALVASTLDAPIDITGQRGGKH